MSHVLTWFDESHIGKKILASTEGEHFEDTGATVTSTSQVNVYLYDRSSQPAPVYARQYFAWANITEDKGSPESNEIGHVGGIWDPDQEEFVEFFGGMSEHVYNNLKVLDVSAKIIFFNINGATKYGYFEETVQIDITQAAPVPGDSGSAVIAQSDKAIVSILMSSSKLHRYFTNSHITTKNISLCAWTLEI